MRLWAYLRLQILGPCAVLLGALINRPDSTKLNYTIRIYSFPGMQIRF